ncbi:MAG: thioredoxin family protein [Kiloniellales bacterium]|nr:thioredoxin family protein [Kiloniellales bacterium]
MKRQKPKIKRTGKKKTGSVAGAGEARKKPNRRDFLRRMSHGALGLAAVGGVGWYVVEEVRASIREKDLSLIGNGTPSVVQIHDPQCPRCRALQRETREALEAFDDGELQYLVANIRTAEGKRLANAHRVGHVTLLLFDAEGRKRDVLVGPSTADILTRAFRRHLARSGGS